MAHYAAWNTALLLYFTSGTSKGAEFYLSVDDDVLRHVREVSDAFDEAEDSELDAPDDFVRAVRSHVLTSQCVDLPKICGVNSEGEPNGVGFLSLMVLAATRMQNSHETHSSDYFTHLRLLLGLHTWQTEPGGSRPQGLSTGSGSALWEEWNEYLRANNWLPTAKAGVGGAQLHINRPKSQALLRQTDRDRLAQFFANLGGKWSVYLDAETLISRLSFRAYQLNKHLQELLSQPERALAASDAIYEIFETNFDGQTSATSGVPRARNSRHMTCALARRQSRRGAVIYSLMPSRRAFVHTVEGAEEGVISVDETKYPLIVEDARRFRAIELLDARHIAQGARFPVEGNTAYREAVLRQAQFWVLARDPDEEGSGTYTSTFKPEWGEWFTILVNDELWPSLEGLRGELLEWERESEIDGAPGWRELLGCELNPSADWKHLEKRYSDCEELLAALRPRREFSISLSGGLRMAGGEFLIGGRPNLSIIKPTAARQELAVVKVFEGLSDKLLTKHDFKLNRSHSLHWDRAGYFRLEVIVGNQTTRKQITVVPWDAVGVETPIPEPAPDETFGPRWGSWQLCGAWNRELQREVTDGTA